MATSPDFEHFSLHNDIQLHIQQPPFVEAETFLTGAPVVIETALSKLEEAKGQTLVISFTDIPMIHPYFKNEVTEALLRPITGKIRLLPLSISHLKQHHRDAPELNLGELALHSVAHELVELDHISALSGRFGVDTRNLYAYAEDENAINKTAAKIMRKSLGKPYWFDEKTGTVRGQIK